MRSPMLTMFFFFSLFLASLAPLQADENCPYEFKQALICADLEWIHGPVLNQKSAFNVYFWRKGDEQKTPFSPPFQVNILTWMNMSNGHHHGGPKITFKEVHPGVYEVKDARFFMHGMSGTWEVRLQLLNDEGLFDMVKVPVTF